MCQSIPCQERRAAPTEHLCRWVCLCGNLLKEEPQVKGLAPATHHTVGTCCAHNLLPHTQRLAMPMADGMEDIQPHSRDQREQYREEVVVQP